MKMLFILAVAYAIIFHWLFPDFKGLGYGMNFHELGFNVDDGENMTIMSKPFYEWYEAHFGWSMLILSFMAIFPTWVMSHYSPLNTRHSLPDGYFIQVLFADMQVAIFMLMLPCWFFLKQMTVLTVLFILVIAYYIIGYKQLIGYEIWGTLWRLAFVFIFVYCCALLLGHLIFYSGPTRDIQVMGYTLPAESFMTCLYIFTGVLILSTGYLINRLVNHFVTRKTRRQDA